MQIRDAPKTGCLGSRGGAHNDMQNTRKEPVVYFGGMAEPLSERR